MRNFTQTHLVLFILILNSVTIFCQVARPQVNVDYKAWVKTIDGTQNQRGFLTELKDSSIVSEEKALLGGIGMAATGAIIGAIVGSAKVSIPIQGDMDAYKRQKEKIEKV